MHISRVGSLALILICGFCGCRSVPHKDGVPDASSRAPLKKNVNRQSRDNAASLLYDLLGNEKDVSKVLIIKSASPELAQLIKNISEAAADGIKTLDALAVSDHRLALHRTSLPPGEVAAREASSKTSEHKLLHTSGKDFEFELLLTQMQALAYGAELAKVAAASEGNENHAHQFSSLGNQLANLYQLVIDRLRR